MSLALTGEPRLGGPAVPVPVALCRIGGAVACALDGRHAAGSVRGNQLRSKESLTKAERRDVRIAAYIHPLFLPQGTNVNYPWHDILASLLFNMAELVPDAECWLITAERFVAESIAQEKCYAESDRLHVVALDEVQLHKSLRGTTPSELTRLIYQGQDRGNRGALRKIGEQIAQAVPHRSFDLILSFAIDTGFLQPFFPSAMRLHLEAGAFCKPPYPSSLYFDHLGMYRWSAIGRHGRRIQDLALSNAQAGFVERFREHYRAALSRTDPFTTCDFRHRFEKLLLLPLQVSNYYSFDEHTPYRTQHEFLLDVLCNVPPSIGVVVTEHHAGGEVLSRDQLGSNADYLASRFPNFLFAERFRQSGFSSQYLVPKVDAVWAPVSNVGFQAMLFNKALGANRQSHLSPLADFDDLSFPGGAIPPPSPKQDALTAWLLQHYLVPSSLFFDGRWLYQYLRRRLESWRTSQDPLLAFEQVGSLDELETAWLSASETGESPRWISPRQGDALKLADGHADKLSRTGVRNTDGLRRARSAARRGIHHRQRGLFLLVNDTAALEQDMHVGCQAITSYLHQRLQSFGLDCAGFINRVEQAEHLFDRIDRSQVRLIVVNGEGSAHHDNRRIGQLMEMCVEAKRRYETRIAFVNAVWQDNTCFLGEPLSSFDYVSVRESRSAEQVEPWTDKAVIVPDLLFSGFPADRTRPTTEDRIDCLVTDCILKDRADALHDFASFHRLPFYWMGATHLRETLGDPGKVFRVGESVFPQLLADVDVLAKCRCCVTGRFHSVVACLAHGVPFVADASNTHKTESLLGDIGLGNRFLLPAAWSSMGNFERFDVVQELRSYWDLEQQQKVAVYVADARREIEQSFKQIRRLVSGGRSKSFFRTLGG